MNTTGYVVFDTYKNRPEDDGNGHFKVYGNEVSARRRAGSLNRAVAGSKIDRWTTRPVVVNIANE